MDETSVWVEDRKWQAVPDSAPARKCSSHRCPGVAVAILIRRTRRGRRVYHYCADHLCGRRVEGGKVFCRVASDSPAAERGFAD